MAGLLHALNDALAVPLDGQAGARDPLDGAAVELARTYASVLDDSETIETGRLAMDKAYRADVIAQYGPLLLGVLVELQLTPRARAAVVKGAGSVPAVNRSALDELRERRRARIDGTTALDSST